MLDRTLDAAAAASPAATAATDHLPITEQHLVQWLAGATPGEQLVYHRGFLAIDTAITSSQLPPSRRQMLLRARHVHPRPGPHRAAPQWRR